MNIISPQIAQAALYEATFARHSVRRYIDKPLAPELVEAMSEEIAAINGATGLHVQLITGEPKAFRGMLAYGKFENVSNYIVMAGTPSKDFEQNVGYYGERLVLLAQTLGLNTCWVGLTYKKVGDAYALEKGEKIACVIAIGYGQNPGVAHKSKTPQEVSNIAPDSPEWFRKGVECALNAPTAINQQKFYFELQSDGSVVSTPKPSLVGYTRIDLGIARLHFELGVDSVMRG